MYKYFCLNPISPVGLEKFSDDYVPAGEMAGADAVLVRSAGMPVPCRKDQCGGQQGMQL